MATYSIKMHPTLPAVVIAATDEFTFQKDFPVFRAEMTRLFDSLSEPVYYVMDLRRLHFDMGEIAQSTNLATRLDNPNFHHRNVRQVIFISADPIWETVAEGLNDEIFGRLIIPVFQTVEDALDYVESQLG